MDRVVAVRVFFACFRLGHLEWVGGIPIPHRLAICYVSGGQSGISVGWRLFVSTTFFYRTLSRGRAPPLSGSASADIRIPSRSFKRSNFLGFPISQNSLFLCPRAWKFIFIQSFRARAFPCSRPRRSRRLRGAPITRHFYVSKCGF